MKNFIFALPPLPDPDDSSAVAVFAGSFNGYKYFESEKVCRSEARAKRRETLVDVRNELFFEARASYHCGDDEYLDVYRELLPLFESFVSEGQA